MRMALAAIQRIGNMQHRGKFCQMCLHKISKKLNGTPYRQSLGVTHQVATFASRSPTENITIRETQQDNKAEKRFSDESREFLHKSHDLIVKEALIKGTDSKTKVVDFKSPEELQSLMDLSIKDTGASSEKMLELYKQTIEYSVQTGHVHYFNQLFSGRDLSALTASWMVEALNTNVMTYEIAPVFTVVEQFIMKEACKKIGYEDGDGICMPGGSLCNFQAIHLARFNYNHIMKTKGMKELPQCVIYTSVEGHYSITKAAHFMGFGTDNVVSVKTDSKGRMIPSDLEAQIKRTKDQGHVPLVVVATSGSTVLGSFDPLDELADVCAKHNCWFHVDACWGGAVLFTENHRHLMKGAERTDSVAISFHKMIGAQIQCAGIMVKNKNILRECNTIYASYLFTPDRTYYDPSYDLGSLTIQCGRRADAYKLWAVWKSRGHQGMQEHVDIAFDNTRYLTERMRNTEGFRFVLPEHQYLNICFWYVPPSLRGQEETPEWWQKLHKVAPKIKNVMVAEGKLAIGYNPLESKGLVNFFRIIIENPLLTHKDLDFVIDEITRLAKDL